MRPQHGHDERAEQPRPAFAGDSPHGGQWLSRDLLRASLLPGP